MVCIRTHSIIWTWLARPERCTHQVSAIPGDLGMHDLEDYHPKEPVTSIVRTRIVVIEAQDQPYHDKALHATYHSPM